LPIKFKIERLEKKRVGCYFFDLLFVFMI